MTVTVETASSATTRINVLGRVSMAGQDGERSRDRETMTGVSPVSS